MLELSECKGSAEALTETRTFERSRELILIHVRRNNDSVLSELSNSCKPATISTLCTITEAHISIPLTASTQLNDGEPRSMNSTKTAANGSTREGASRNLASIRPFFIVKDLQTSISYYRERLGFQLDFQGPDDDPYYAGVSRDGIGIMLKAILPDVLPCPNHTRHPWARWDAYIYTLDPDTLFDEFASAACRS